jgi:uracil-DNA glycosylase
VTELQPFSSWSGPRNARIVLVGEAHGASEDECKLPFAGESGKELFRMLGEAWPLIAPDEHHRLVRLHRFGLAWIREREGWLRAASCAMTNVFNLRPRGNAIDELCGPRASVTGTVTDALPPLRLGKYLQPQHLSELERLYHELALCRPNIVVALGNTAAWALMRTAAISSIRGTTAPCAAEPIAGLKCLPTFHPASLLYTAKSGSGGGWSNRPVVIADLMKALRESEWPEIRRPSVSVLIDPTIEEIEAWVEATLTTGLRLESPSPLACDIETGAGQIKCVGFARSRSEALVIPFVDFARADGSYWSDTGLERRAWDAVGRLLGSGLPLVFQNGLYDLQYLLRMGLRPANCAHDTMLHHHALFPEMSKGLGFLGSVYTGHSSWKLNYRIQRDSEKRDE